MRDFHVSAAAYKKVGENLLRDSIIGHFSTTDKVDINRQKGKMKYQYFTKLIEVFCQYSSRNKNTTFNMNVHQKTDKENYQEFFLFTFCFLFIQFIFFTPFCHCLYYGGQCESKLS